MKAIPISTKELREELPRIRAGLARGNHYTLIYRSKPIAQLQPLTPKKSNTPVRITGGTLRLQENTDCQLTPEYLDELAAGRYAQ